MLHYIYTIAILSNCGVSSGYVAKFVITKNLLNIFPNFKHNSFLLKKNHLEKRDSKSTVQLGLNNGVQSVPFIGIKGSGLLLTAEVGDWECHSRCNGSQTVPTRCHNSFCQNAQENSMLNVNQT